MREAFWNGLFDVRWEEAPLGPEAIRLIQRPRERGYAVRTCRDYGHPVVHQGRYCTKSRKATGFAMMGSPRTSSPVICRSVAIQWLEDL
jgi:hypothetical protein